MLTALYVHGTLNQTDLPKFTGVEKSAVARNIARLGGGAWQAKPGSAAKVERPGLGLIESYQEPTDRRFNMVRLSPKGRSVLEALSKDAMALL
jgi:DNA-binding MarR family transcriptional regulator